MSLAHALTQISIGSTLDTWWKQGHAARTYYGNKARIADNKERRLAILTILQRSGQAMTITDVQEASGFSRQTVINFASRLEDDGKVVIDRSNYPVTIKAV